MLRLRAAVVLLVVATSGCETLLMGTGEQYRIATQSYIGESIDSIVDQFGYADSLSEAPDGNRVFVYSSFHVNNSPVDCSEDSNGNHSCSGGDISQNWCKTYFEVDSGNIIVNVSSKGNGCGICREGSLCFR